jgi:hypothetical protein
MFSAWPDTPIRALAGHWRMRRRPQLITAFWKQPLCGPITGGVTFCDRAGLRQVPFEQNL